MSRVWKEEEITKLIQLINQNKTKTEIAEELGRTVTAVQLKVNRLGLAIYNTSDNKGNRGRNWNTDQDNLLKELWSDPELSKSVICNRLHRSYYSIRKRALILNLGSRSYNDEYLSMSDVSEYMNVSIDRVSNWCKLGLPRKKSRSGKTKFLIDIDDLLKFLYNHQDMFDASKISEYLFYSEPQWLIDKRKKDKEFYPENLRKEFSNEEDKKIQSYFYMGYSDDKIAKLLKRTSQSIFHRRHVLNLMKGRYTDDEINILKKYSRYKTIDEIHELLPNRSNKSIEYKCCSLKIPYHIKKDRCEIMEE